MPSANVLSISELNLWGCNCPDDASQRLDLSLVWAGSGLELYFTGTELAFQLEADFQQCEPWIAVEQNGAPLLRMPLSRGVSEVCLFRGMTDGVPKHVRLFKETQPILDALGHRLTVKAVRWEGGGLQPFLTPPPPSCYLHFIGDSLTSGEGVVGALQETDWVPALFSASQTWARHAARLLGGEFSTVSQSGWGLRSGWDNDPSHRLPALYEQVQGKFGASPDAVIINLGTNDASAMKNPPFICPDRSVFKQEDSLEGFALVEQSAVDFLCMLRRCHPRAKLVWAYGMAEDPLRPAFERAVNRFRSECGDPDAYYLPLPSVTAETMGSRQHPGPVCHQEAGRITADFLETILR